jgi:hypothetical protein
MLGYRVAITVDDPVLDGYFQDLYAAFPATDTTEHEYHVGPADNGRYALCLDNVQVGEAETAEGLVGTVVNHVNRQAATQAEHVLIHAGGVERDGAAIVLPAHMEYGKTTLTTGLVRAGFRYLTDEAVAILRETHQVVPYPKPMTIDPGSWSLFPELEPHEPFATDDYKRSQWQVPPSAFGPDVVGSPCRVRLVVFPQYDAEVTTELLPLSRAEALIELAKNTFRFDQEGRPTLEVLAAVIAEADAYRLPNCSLHEAVALIVELAEQSIASRN